MTTLDRVHITTSRKLEFFTAKELSMQLGESRQNFWAATILKELIDNSLDACETAGILPDIEVDTDLRSYLTVTDNGPGIPQQVIESSMDYDIRISDKNLYISPSRGQLGNALKCAWAMPYVMDEENGFAAIRANGTQYTARVRVDQLVQVPRFEVIREAAEHVKNGTSVSLHGIFPASSWLSPESFFYKLAKSFSIANPHMALRLNDAHFERRTDTVQKWMPNNPISPHWYSLPDLVTMLGRLISNGADMPVRDFIKGFRGLSGTAKQSKVLSTLGLQRERLSSLVLDGAIDEDKAGVLLELMKEHSRMVKPKDLGHIGEGNLSFLLGDLSQTAYRSKFVDVDGMPYVLEVFFGVKDLQGREGDRHYAVNFSALMDCPSTVISEAMSDGMIHSDDPVFLFTHIVSPKVEFADRGKSRLRLPDEVEDELRKAILSVSSDWTKLKRKADREGRVAARELTELIRQQQRKFMSARAASFKVMEEAYMKASGNGKYPTKARMVFYAARPMIQVLTGKTVPYKDSRTFTSTVLPEYMDAFPEKTAAWDIIFDARGNLTEPHTGRGVPLGTLHVRGYVRSWENSFRINKPLVDLDTDAIAETSGPHFRFKNVVFIEKEGFDPILNTARTAEKFDIAIMSTKGMTVTAARSLVAALSKQGVTIYMVRDFDKAGFSIVHTLANSTKRFKYDTPPNIIDFGLRLEDVKAMGLESEEVSYDSKVSPKVNLLESGATEAEADFLVSGGWAGNWTGQRVELNAMTAPQFIEWLEKKLVDAGVKKVVPDEDEIIGWYRFSYRRGLLKKRLDKILDELTECEVEIPDDLQDRLAETLEKDDHLPWDMAVSELAMDDIKDEDEDAA